MSDAFFRTLAKNAAARYPAGDRWARRFAFGKLTRDPAFRHLLSRGLIASGARVLDLGCGQGLIAALFTEASMPVAYRGIDLMQRDIDRATHAVGASAQFTCGDIRSADFGSADVVVILDVLHYIDYAAQEDVLRRVRSALGSGGVLLLRVGDESNSFRFKYTVWIDRAVMALRGHRLERLYCKPLAQWVKQLEALGFSVDSVPMSEGTPFANVLLVARYHSG